MLLLTSLMVMNLKAHSYKTLHNLNAEVYSCLKLDRQRLI